MSISQLEESELPEHYSVFTLVHARDPADSTGQVVLSAPGHHPKCRLADLKVVVTAYSTAVDVGAIEDGDGNDAATFTCAAVVGSKQTAKTIIQGQVFERNEAICVNLTTDGNAANAFLLFATFESIH